MEEELNILLIFLLLLWDLCFFYFISDFLHSGFLVHKSLKVNVECLQSCIKALSCIVTPVNSSVTGYLLYQHIHVYTSLSRHNRCSTSTCYLTDISYGAATTRLRQLYFQCTSQVSIYTQGWREATGCLAHRDRIQGLTRSENCNL